MPDCRKILSVGTRWSSSMTRDRLRSPKRTSIATSRSYGWEFHSDNGTRTLGLVAQAGPPNDRKRRRCYRRDTWTWMIRRDLRRATVEITVKAQLEITAFLFACKKMARPLSLYVQHPGLRSFRKLHRAEMSLG